MLNRRENPQELSLNSDPRALHPTMLSELNPAYKKFLPSAIDPLIWKNISAPPIIPDRRHFVAVIGPSASGKDSIVDGVTIPFAKITTTTTRPKRNDEQQLERSYNFVSKKKFDALLSDGAFIETVRLGTHESGTTVRGVYKALQQNIGLAVWRGEETGLKQLWPWLQMLYPAFQRHVVFILPQMPMRDVIQRITEKRGVTDSDWRIRQAYNEILLAGANADYILFNPPQIGGPLDATRAMQNLFTYFLGR
jgi:guanylate kinase